MVKFPLKFFYNIGVISEILELPRFCPDFLQKKFYNIKPWLSAHLSCSEALTRLYRTTSPEFGYCLCWCYQTNYVAVTK